MKFPCINFRNSGDNQNSLNSTQEELVKVTESLAQLYHHVCEVNGETPNRVLLEHVQGRRFRRQDSPKDSDTDKSSDREGTPSDREKSPEKEGSPDDVKGDPIACYKLIETIHDQIKYLRRAVEHTIDMSRQKQVDTSQSQDVAELQEQVVKLKAMLSTKREQIATLRSVLKANKSTAEIALANLKQKYENEKTIVTETMIRLKNELKALKEDAATFASLRAMFAQRCDEYVTQLDEPTTTTDVSRRREEDAELAATDGHPAEAGSHPTPWRPRIRPRTPQHAPIHSSQQNGWDAKSKWATLQQSLPRRRR